MTEVATVDMEALHGELLRRLDLRRVDVNRMSDEELWRLAQHHLRDVLDGRIDATERAVVERRLLQEVVGVGVLEDLLRDAAANDSVLSPDLIAGYRRALRTPDWELALLAMLRDTDRDPPPVSEVQVPTLIVWGAADTWVSPDEGAWLERAIPGAERIVLDGAGHLPMHERPEAFQAALLDFLDGD